MFKQYQFLFYILLGMVILWYGSKYFSKFQIKYYKSKTEKAEKQLLECYELQAQNKISEKLQRCLKRAKNKTRKIEHCKRKYGSDK